MDILKPYRQKIDSLDDKIADLLARRLEIIRQVGALKARENIPAVLPARVEEVKARMKARARENGTDPALVDALYTLLIERCCAIEDEMITHANTKSASARESGSRQKRV